PQLRYPFATVLLVIVEADSDIQRKAVFQQALLQIQVSGNIVQLDICQHCVVGSVAIPVLRLPAEPLKIDACGGPVPFENGVGLEERESQHPVCRVEAVWLGWLSCQIAVVDLVSSEIVLEPDFAGGSVVFIFNGKRAYPASDVGIVVGQGG